MSFTGEKNKKILCLTYSFLFNFLFFLVLNIWSTACFEIGDDLVLSQHIANGEYNFIFSNYFLVRIFGWIEQLIYPLNAYAITSMAFSVLSMTTVTYIFAEKFDWKKATLFTLYIHSFLAVGHFLTVSFTRYAACFSVVGLFTIVHFTRQKKWKIGTIWGLILSLLGSMYRFKIFESMFIMGVVFVASICLTEFFDKEKSERKIINLIKIIFEPKRLICALLVLLISFSLNAFSKKINNSTQELQHYKQYTAARSAVWDYSIPNYEDAKEAYDKIGIDENDILMIRKGMFDEKGGYSLEQLENIQHIQAQYNKEHKSPYKVFVNMLFAQWAEVKQLSIAGISIIAVFAAFISFILFQKKKRLLPVLLIIAATMIIYYYLSYIGRIRYRIVYGVFLFDLISIIYLLDNKLLEKRTAHRSVKIITILVIFAISCAGMYLSNQKTERTLLFPPTSRIRETVHELMCDTNAKYEFFAGKTVAWSGDIDVEDVYHVKKNDTSINYFEQPHVYYLSPYYNKTLKAFGTDNVYKNLLNDNVYAVFSNDEDRKDYQDYLHKYLQKYYSQGKTVTMKTVKIYPDYTVYKYSLT